MFKRTMIAAGIALALVTSASMAADQPQQVTFELQAVITAPVFSAWKAAGQDGTIESTGTVEDGFNPTFEPLRVEMTGGQDPVDAKLVAAFELVNGDQTLPMQAMINATALTMESAIEVAAAGELANSIKTVEITVTGNTTTAPRVGTYTGDFVVLFEPRLDTGETPPAPIAS